MTAMATIIVMSTRSNSPPDIEIGQAAKTHRYLFIFYILALVATVILSIFVWTSANKYHDIVKHNADIKISNANVLLEKAKAEVAKANERIADLEIQAKSLKLETERAKENIALAQKQAAQANAEAAKANETAEAERLERVKLEASLAPRIIVVTPETTNELKLFSGTSVAIEFDQDDPETKRLVGQIMFMLKSANWDFTAIIPTNSILQDGVRIFTKRIGENPPWTGKSTDAGKILSYQLKENGIKVGSYFPLRPQSPEFKDAPTADMLIQVGKIPQDYFIKKRLPEWAREGMEKAGDYYSQISEYERKERAEILEKYKKQ